MSFIGELWEETFGVLTGEKRWKQMMRQTQKQSEEAFKLQREIYDELKRRLPWAEQRLAQGYLMARDKARENLGRALGQLQLNQNIQNRYLGRLGATNILSSGGVENAVRSLGESLGNATLGLYSQLGLAETQLFADETSKAIALPVEYLRGMTGALGVAPQYMSSMAQMFSVKPPSLFDYMAQMGSAYMISSGFKAGAG